MITLITNEWMPVLQGLHPWKDREVLCRFADGRKENLAWNGYYWYDPQTHIRKMFPPHEGPTHFYIYEKFPEK